MKASVQPADRTRALITERNRKMAASVHAYVRGSTKRFYAWLERSGDAELPDGPPVWICGDCHIGNLGPVASSDGKLSVQIRDLDQTVIGNPAHDLVRLALSLAMLARSADLPGVTTAVMIESMMEGYARTFSGQADLNTDARFRDIPKTIRVLVRQAAGRSWKSLADHGITQDRPSLPIGKRFWPLTHDERRAVENMFSDKPLVDLVTSLHGASGIELVDTAYWKKGCSSLGRLRIAALLRTGRGASQRYCLIDIKEAVSATAPHAAEHDGSMRNAARVVMGANQLSPYLGARMVATELLDKSVFIRELMPQDLKIEIKTLTQKEAQSVADFVGYTLGTAHARQLNLQDKSRWLNELQRDRSRSLDAPSWLWNSVVDLVATHEAAYLQHCRRYALDETADA